MPQFIVNVSLTHADLMELHLYLRRTIPAFRKTHMRYMLVPSVSMLLLAMTLYFGSGAAFDPLSKSSLLLLTLFLTPGICLLAYPLASDAIYRRYRLQLFKLQNDDVLQSATRYQLDISGITESTSSQEAKYAWHSVSDVNNTGTHVFLRTQGLQTLIFPRSAFTSDAEFQAFDLGCRALRESSAA
jgi:YcxB-like protein